MDNLDPMQGFLDQLLTSWEDAPAKAPASNAAGKSAPQPDRVAAVKPALGEVIETPGVASVVRALPDLASAMSAGEESETPEMSALPMGQSRPPEPAAVSADTAPPPPVAAAPVPPPPPPAPAARVQPSFQWKPLETPPAVTSVTTPIAPPAAASAGASKPPAHDPAKSPLALIDFASALASLRSSHAPPAPPSGQLSTPPPDQDRAAAAPPQTFIAPAAATKTDPPAEPPRPAFAWRLTSSSSSADSQLATPKPPAAVVLPAAAPPPPPPAPAQDAGEVSIWRIAPVDEEPAVEVDEQLQVPETAEVIVAPAAIVAPAEIEIEEAEPEGSIAAAPPAVGEQEFAAVEELATEPAPVAVAPLSWTFRPIEDAKVETEPEEAQAGEAVREEQAIAAAESTWSPAEATPLFEIEAIEEDESVVSPVAESFASWDTEVEQEAEEEQPQPQVEEGLFDGPEAESSFAAPAHELPMEPPASVIEEEEAAVSAADGGFELEVFDAAQTSLLASLLEMDASVEELVEAAPAEAEEPVAEEVAIVEEPAGPAIEAEPAIEAAADDIAAIEEPVFEEHLQAGPAVAEPAPFSEPLDLEPVPEPQPEPVAAEVVTAAIPAQQEEEEEEEAAPAPAMAFEGQELGEEFEWDELPPVATAAPIAAPTAAIDLSAEIARLETKLPAGQWDQQSAEGRGIGLRRHLVFQINDELYAVNLSNLIEIDNMPRWTGIPGLPPAVRGLINMRGEILSLLDLRAILNLPTPAVPKKGKIFIASTPDRLASSAFAVDEVHGLAGFTDEQFRDVPELAAGSAHITATIEDHDRLVRILDVEGILSEVEKTFSPDQLWS